TAASAWLLRSSIADKRPVPLASGIEWPMRSRHRRSATILSAKPSFDGEIILCLSFACGHVDLVGPDRQGGGCHDRLLGHQFGVIGAGAAAQDQAVVTQLQAEVVHIPA